MRRVSRSCFVQSALVAAIARAHVCHGRHCSIAIPGRDDRRVGRVHAPRSCRTGVCSSSAGGARRLLRRPLRPGHTGIHTGRRVPRRVQSQPQRCSTGGCCSSGRTAPPGSAAPADGSYTRMADAPVTAEAVAERLQDGRVLLAGGGAAYVFDPATDAFVETGAPLAAGYGPGGRRSCVMAMSSSLAGRDATTSPVAPRPLRPGYRDVHARPAR